MYLKKMSFLLLFLERGYIVTQENKFDLTPYGINQTKRVTIPAAEEILFMPFLCLDHGFVRLIDYMGSDERIVQAARVGYGKGTKKVSEDNALIRYLSRHEHTTPEEKPHIEYHIKTPIFVIREWYRHRTGKYASFNEESLRYSEPDGDYYVPEEDSIGFQDTSNRQGRSKINVPQELKEFTINQIKENSEQALKRYITLLEKGIAKEIARDVLPVNFYTSFYWTMDLHNMFHFLKLRMGLRALEEFRVYANTIGDITKKIFPSSYSAFEDYVLNAEKFSSAELNVLKILLDGKISVPDEVYQQAGLKGRELNEFKSKLEKLVS